MQPRLKQWLPYGILLLVLAVAYLPVSTFYFGMKNDAFSTNFPNKFFLSQAIHRNSLTQWNPYLNFGFPVYADMGFAFYNPITWLFGWLGYNAYTLTLEVLLYIYLAGVFMFRLGRFFKFGNAISVTVAAMYMCSGFFTGCLQYINFLTAAAFLPLVLQMLLQLLNKPGFKASFYFAVAGYFVFAGGHPAIPIGTAYFLAILLLLLFCLHAPYRQNAKPVLSYFGLGVGLLLVFCLPALYSYISILPYYARGAAPQQSLYTQAGFSLQSYQSFIFPFSTAANSSFFGTDVAMRNGFFSITGFICALLAFKIKNQTLRAVLLAGFVMLLLSLGGPVKPVLYNMLPLLDHIRYNGEFRVFPILCFCIAAGFGLQQLKNGDVVFERWLKILLLAVAAIGLCLCVILLASGQLTGLGLPNGPARFQQTVKALLAAPLPWFFLASAFITVVVCLLSVWALKAKSFNVLLLVALADLAINSVMYLPVTGVGQVTLKDIQAVYDSSPAGLPAPPLKPINAIDTLDAKTTGLVGDITYYNKLIGTRRLTNYPSYFTSTEQYFNDKPLVAQISKKPYLFLKNDSVARISVVMFGAGRIGIKVKASSDDTLVFLQNNYPFWHTGVNRNKQKIETVFKTFMAVKINKGPNEIVFFYQDGGLTICIEIALGVVSLCLFIIVPREINEKQQGLSR